MIASNYSPRPGSKAALALQLLAEEGPQNRARIASHIEASSSSVDGILDAAIRAGVVIKIAGKSGSMFWSIAGDVDSLDESAQDATEEVEAAADDDAADIDSQGEVDDAHPAHFACSIWSDGELQIIRAGEVFTLSAQHTSELRAYLQQFSSNGSAA